MQKVEFTLPTSGKWQSLVTKYAPLGAMVSADSFTEGSSNFITHLTGNIEKRWTDSLYNVTNLGSGPLNDNYEMVFGNGIRNLIFRDNTSLWYTPGNNLAYEVYSPVNADGFFEYISYLNVAYMDNAIDSPLSYDINGVYGGVTYVPVTIAVTNYLNLVGGTITIGSTVLTEGTDYHAVTSNAVTLANIATAIRAIAGTPYVVVNSGGILSVTNSGPTLTTPVVISGSLGYTLSSISFPRVRAMGVTAPTSAPTFAADTSGGSVPAGPHTYLVTFLYYGFEESNGGPASTVHTVVTPNFTVHLTAIPLGGYGVTARNIYRDNADGNYVLIGTLTNNTATTLIDTSLAGTLPLVYTNGLPPIYGLTALWLSRDFVAKVPGEPSTLYWSNPNQMDSWNPDNFLVCNPSDTITGLVVYQGSLFVFNQFSFGYITGNTDSSFAYQAVPSSNIGCVDNRSIQIRVIDGIPELIFCSAKGVYAYNGSSLRYISDPIEPDLNVNLSQINILNGTNTQVSLTDWQSGTSTPGIDLVSNPGVLTTINPTASYSTEAQWATGTLTNLSTEDGTSSLKVPAPFTPVDASGTVTSNTTFQEGFLTTLSNNAAFWNAGTNVNINTSIPGHISRKWFLLDNFADGNYTANPAWAVSAGSFSVGASGGHEWLNALYSVSAGLSQIYTSSYMAYGAWQFTFTHTEIIGGAPGGSPSGNYVQFISNSTGTIPGGSNGYYLLWQDSNVSGQTPYVRLYRSEASSADVNLSNYGSGSVTGQHTWTVTRTPSGVFNVFMDGSILNSMTVTDNTYTTSSEFQMAAYYPYNTCSITDIYYSSSYAATDVTSGTSNSPASSVITIDQLTTPASEGLLTDLVTLPSPPPGGSGSVTVNTRTSPDNATWSSYVALGAGNAIMSPANRYIQIQYLINTFADAGAPAGNFAGPDVTNFTATWGTVSSLIYNAVNSFGAASTGTWVSPTYDSYSLNNISSGMSLILGGSYPSGTSVSVLIQGASDSLMSTITSTQTLSNPNGTVSLSTSTSRYWRITYTLASTNGLYSPTISPPILVFNTTSTWLSPIITTTSDATAFTSLTTVDTIPAGTSVTTTIRTGAVAIPDGSWSAYTAVGSATPSTYAQIKSVLVASTGDLLTPMVSSIVLNWSLSSTFISQPIDTTANPPSGFGLFTTADFLNGGTVSFAFRTASTLVGLSSAAWTTVLPGTTPTNTPLEFTQWEAIISPTANHVPIIDSVTTRWLTGTGTIPVRLASLFFDKTYYLFASTLGNATNNVCFAFDYLNNWREFGNITVADICTFFAIPYYLDAVRNNIYQWQIPLSGGAWGPVIPAPLLASAASYGTLAATTITNTGATVITGNLGLFPGTSVTGAPTVTGTSNVANTAAQVAQRDALAAYTSLAAMTPTKPVNTTLSSATLTAGVYPYSSSASLTGTLTLSGSTTDVFVFQIASTLTTATSSHVVLSGVLPQNVFWQVGSSATLGTSSTLNGTIIANTSITVDGGTGATVHGQLIALNGAITIAAIALITSVGMGSTTGPVPFVMDVRTKDFNLSSMTTLKNARSCWVGLTNTGTTITVYYSTDNGNTWLSMLESSTGASTYTTSTSGTMCNVRFVPNYAEYTNAVAGTSIMFRVTSADSFPAQILFIRPAIVARAGTYIGVGL